VKILETERLVIRECTTEDAPFVLELLNSPKFVKYIGDRGVRTVEDAGRYIAERFIASYQRHGYGLYAVELRADAGTDSESEISDPKWIGLCGLVNRPSLEHPDVGFAFLPEFEGRGYGTESATSIIEHAWTKLGLKHLLAITTLDNDASVALLKKLGFSLVRVVDENGEKLNLFELKLSSPPS
jgi:RimJ/RimL family protein N-acetyltransferase